MADPFLEEPNFNSVKSQLDHSGPSISDSTGGMAQSVQALRAGQRVACDWDTIQLARGGVWLRHCSAAFT